MRDIMDYTKNENFKYLVIKASHGNYYGFNLKVKKERTFVMKIVNPVEQNKYGGRLEGFEDTSEMGTKRQ